MNRRSFLTLFPLAGFAAAFGIKLKAEPEINDAMQIMSHAGRTGSISGEMLRLHINGQSFPIKTDETDFRYRNRLRKKLTNPSSSNFPHQ